MIIRYQGYLRIWVFDVCDEQYISMYVQIEAVRGQNKFQNT